MMTISSRSTDTRNTILSVSLALFSKDGYDATSVAQICEGAQVSKGAFYHHFPTKQDLFLALMTRWLDEMDGMFQVAGETAVDVPEALERMGKISGGIFASIDEGFPILLEFWRQASRNQIVWEQAVAPYRRYLDYFAGIIQTGIEEGAFDENLNPDSSARILMAMAMGLLLQASFDSDGPDWGAITQSGIKILLRGMRRQA